MGRPADNEAEQELYRQIRRAIAERRLLPGTKLTEESLAELFGVSRARVRKVLLLLSKDYIVQQRPNRGAYVWRPTVKEARDILEARRLVELFLVRQAATHATPAQIKALRGIIDSEFAAREAQQTSRIMRLSGEFHIRLASCANNPILEDFLSSLVSRCYLILAVYQKRDAEDCPQDDHAPIVDCLDERDPDRAVALLDRHFDHIEQELDLVEESTEDKTDLRKILKSGAS